MNILKIGNIRNKRFCKMCLALIDKSDAYDYCGKRYCERCMNDILDSQAEEKAIEIKKEVENNKENV